MSVRFAQFLVEDWTEHQQRRLDAFPRQGDNDAFVAIDSILKPCAPPDVCAKALALVEDFESNAVPPRKLTLAVRALIPTQAAVQHAKVEAIGKTYNAQSFSPLWVMEYRGNFYVVDGHHRIAAAAMLGEENIECLVLYSAG